MEDPPTELERERAKARANLTKVIALNRENKALRSEVEALRGGGGAVPNGAPHANGTSEVEELRATLASQHAEIEQLRRAAEVPVPEWLKSSSPVPPQGSSPPPPLSREGSLGAGPTPSAAAADTLASPDWLESASAALDELKEGGDRCSTEAAVSAAVATAVSAAEATAAEALAAAQAEHARQTAAHDAELARLRASVAEVAAAAAAEAAGTSAAARAAAQASHRSELESLRSEFSEEREEGLAARRQLEQGLA